MSEPRRVPPAPAELLADLLDGGLLVVTGDGRDGDAPGGAVGSRAGGIATLLQPDGDVVTLLAGPAGGHGAATLARHAAAVRQATKRVRRAARRLRRRTRLEGLAGLLLTGGAVAAGAVAFGRVPGTGALGWLAALGGLAGVGAGLAPIVWRAGLGRARARRGAAANRAWLADHGFQIARHGLSSRALTRRG